jgi:hypothetical protein
VDQQVELLTTATYQVELVGHLLEMEHREVREQEDLVAAVDLHKLPSQLAQDLLDQQTVVMVAQAKLNLGL